MITMNNYAYIVGPKKLGVQEPVMSAERLEEIKKSASKYSTTCPCCGQRLELKTVDEYSNMTKEEIESIIDALIDLGLNNLVEFN